MQPTRTKIVATVGPASGTPEGIRSLVRAGVDIFRLNFSHGDHAQHREFIRLIREAAKESGAPIGIMQDLQGPRIRTGPLRDHEPVTLQDGAEVTVRPALSGVEGEGDASEFAISYERLHEDVKPGDEILLADGMLELEVERVEGKAVRCRVKTGGELGEHKGVNLPGVRLRITVPTDKDVEDLRFGMDQGVDFVALSFVCSAQDVERLKQAMREYGGEEAVLPVVPKIERPEAMEHLREILAAGDGVMVARGDLGIEMRTEEVPGAQKRILRMANSLGVPAITATQMLESMVGSRRPTRAEAADVANAILDGTDAVMLSAETSVGHYPAVCVRTMDNIARETERHRREEGAYSAPDIEVPLDVAAEHALASAACTVADTLGAAGIVAFTITGATARYLSQRRPGAPIFALTCKERTYRRMTLLWGVTPVLVDEYSGTDEMISSGRARLRELGLVGTGDTVVYVAGAGTMTPGGVNMLKIEKFED
jgi:pyruvate kinase